MAILAAELLVGTTENRAAELAVPAASGPASSAGMSDIQKMLDARLDPQLIKAFVSNSPVAYNPTATELIGLKQRGVPDDLIVTLLQRGAEVRAQLAKAAWANYPPPAPPAPPPGYSEQSVGGYQPPAYSEPATYADYSPYNYGDPYGYGYPPYGYGYGSPYWWGGGGYPWFGWPFFFDSFSHRHFHSFDRFGRFHGGFHTARFNGGFGHGNFGRGGFPNSGGRGFAGGFRGSFGSRGGGMRVAGGFRGGGGGRGGGGHR